MKRYIPQTYPTNAYRLLLSNYLGSCHRAEQYGDFLETIEKIKKIPIHTENEKIEHFQKHPLSRIAVFFKYCSI